MMLYGLTNQKHAVDIARTCCNLFTLPVGNPEARDYPALLLLLETAAQETRLGKFPDPNPFGAGIGLCQFDQIGFKDVVERTHPRVKMRVMAAIWVDMDKLQHRDLAFSPLLSFLFCRLFYLLRPGEIPTTIEGRADYWKQWYNTPLGKGHQREYIESAKQIVAPLIGGY